MSVQAVGAAELDKKNIKSLEDISSISPAVTFNNVGPGKSNFYIRGVSDGAIMNSYASPEATTALYIIGLSIRHSRISAVINICIVITVIFI